VAIGNLHAVNRLIQSRFLGTLYIAGHVPDGDSELYFGVTKDAPELAAILRRALESVTPTDIATAKNRWLDTVYPASRARRSPPSSRCTRLGLALAAGCLLLGFGLTRERLARRETDAPDCAHPRPRPSSTRTSAAMPPPCSGR
jgi:two-component system sensor histidine kinase EvgS